jgi:glutathione S-transferase
MTARLVTIPMSHYCEKARWALDFARLPYVEERTFGDSTDILGWVHRQRPIYRDDAAELEERFDTVLGKAARILAVHHVAGDRKLARRIALAGVPGWERAMGTVFFGAALMYLRRLYGISPESIARSLVDTRAVFAEVGKRLADGRRYLCGGELGAADITFAALAAPVLFPESPRTGLPALDEVKSPELRALVDELRATDAGRFAMRLYAGERG